MTPETQNQDKKTVEAHHRPPKWTQSNFNPLAFPRPAFVSSDKSGSNWRYNNNSEDGMTLRDFFAIKFAAAKYAHELTQDTVMDDRYVCERAYALADAMLEARISESVGGAGA